MNLTEAAQKQLQRQWMRVQQLFNAISLMSSQLVGMDAFHRRKDVARWAHCERDVYQERNVKRDGENGTCFDPGDPYIDLGVIWSM